MRKGSQTPAYYPAFLDLKDRECVVIGGGAVALRKVTSLLECGARVRMVSPKPCPQIVELAEKGQIRVSRRGYRTGDLAGAFLAIAATDDREINRRVAVEARERSVLVNVVDDAGHSSFISPSIVRRGGLTMAISTGGLSPALARKIRARLERDFGGEYGVLACLVDEVRHDMKRRGIKVHAEAWQEALDLDLLAGLVRDGKREEVKETLYRHLLKEKEEVRQG